VLEEVAEEEEMDMVIPDHRGREVEEVDLITIEEGISAQIESGRVKLKLPTTAGKVPEDTQGLLEETETVHLQEGLQSAVEPLELAQDHQENPQKPSTESMNLALKIDFF